MVWIISHQADIQTVYDIAAWKMEGLQKDFYQSIFENICYQISVYECCERMSPALTLSQLRPVTQ